MGNMSTGPAGPLQGTLDLLILRTLATGEKHGYEIADWIHAASAEALSVEEGALYPALHRLEDRGWLSSFWGTSENNRKARYYRLTPLGKRQLAAETSKWHQLVHAVGRVLRPMEEQ